MRLSRDAAPFIRSRLSAVINRVAFRFSPAVSATLLQAILDEKRRYCCVIVLVGVCLLWDSHEFSINQGLLHFSMWTNKNTAGVFLST